MMGKDNKSKVTKLRRNAEDSLKKKAKQTGSKLIEAEALKLIHELEVHQIELEMQNEELEKARISAQDSSEKYAELYDFAPSGYVSLSADGEIQKLNLVCESILGKERLHLVNKNFAYFVSDDTRLQFNGFLQRVFISNSKETCEVVITNGITSPIYIYIEGILLGNGKECMTTLVDITAEKKAKAELYKLNAELEQRVAERTAMLTEANREIESFAYSVSHDLQAPLRHINGFIGLLREMKTTQRTEEELRYMDIIYNGAEEMSKLIDGLLSFSRFNRTELRKGTINTSKMVNQVIRLLESETKDRKVTFDIGYIPDCEGDEQLIKQVWINLISNAIKYTGKKAEAFIQISSIDHHSETEYIVKDNGAGFNMQFVDKIFGVFQRLHKTRDFEGVGIGLANVKSIVTRHKGHCKAEGEPGKGATFSFTLPK
jgi:PAS domain S-box-containing protein